MCIATVTKASFITKKGSEMWDNLLKNQKITRSSINRKKESKEGKLKQVTQYLNPILMIFFANSTEK
jgi:hypothetical protein